MSFVGLGLYYKENEGKISSFKSAKSSGLRWICYLWKEDEEEVKKENERQFIFGFLFSFCFGFFWRKSVSFESDKNSYYSLVCLKTWERERRKKTSKNPSIIFSFIENLSLKIHNCDGIKRVTIKGKNESLFTSRIDDLKRLYFNIHKDFFHFYYYFPVKISLMIS